MGEAPSQRGKDEKRKGLVKKCSDCSDFRQLWISDIYCMYSKHLKSECSDFGAFQTVPISDVQFTD